MRTIRLGSVLIAALFLGCEGPAGPPGSPGGGGDPGGDGTDGVDGTDGTDGTDGADGRSTWLTGPGLTFEVLEADIGGDGKAEVTFRIADAAGVPLDLNGKYTEGAVTPRFVLAWLDEANGQPLGYSAYTSREVTSSITGNKATQATTDAGGAFEEVGVGEGVYVYRFGTTAEVANPGRTHTVGVFATRDFGDQRYVANATFDFRPDGEAVAVRREVVTTESCNQCHNPLQIHGGARRETSLCILCHSPQSTDPDTGNTVDFKVMVHKIHAGEHLPSVAAGTPYQIIGYGGSVHDYSTVVFPQEVNRCQTCHGAGANADLWKTRPTAASCGSCHDNVAFVQPVPEGMIEHPGGVQPDSACANCHQPSGNVLAITDVHRPLADHPNAPKVELEILSVTNTAPGQQPELTFKVLVSGQPRDILAQPMNSLRMNVAGPTTDYERTWSAGIQGSGSSGTLVAVDAAAGIFRYTAAAAAAVPADATGSYAFGLEGYIQLAGSSQRYAAVNPIAFAAVTDAQPVPRRSVVYRDGCNSCHNDISAHGGGRKNPDYCVMCHNPTKAGDGRIARWEGSTVVAPPVDFKVMIHKIHRGEALSQPYVLGGFPAPSVANPGGTPIDFGHTRFPGDLRACWSCHKAGSFDLPLAATVLPSRSEILTCTEDPSADADDYCNTRSVEYVYTRPTTAVCTSCHDSAYTMAHAEIMTTVAGVESCTTCHGPNAAYDMRKYHRLAP